MTLETKDPEALLASLGFNADDQERALKLRKSDTAKLSPLEIAQLDGFTRRIYRIAGLEASKLPRRTPLEIVKSG